MGGIPAILLKGPVIATRLYDRRVERPYADVDILVPRERFADAARIAATLG
jgi:hypothetical protein